MGLLLLLLNRIDSTAPAISDTGLSLPTHLNASSTQSRLSTSVFSFRGIKNRFALWLFPGLPTNNPCLYVEQSAPDALHLSQDQNTCQGHTAIPQTAVQSVLPFPPHTPCPVQPSLAYAFRQSYAQWTQQSFTYAVVAFYVFFKRHK